MAPVPSEGRINFLPWYLLVGAQVGLTSFWVGSPALTRKTESGQCVVRGRQAPPTWNLGCHHPAELVREGGSRPLSGEGMAARSEGEQARRVKTVKVQMVQARGLWIRPSVLPSIPKAGPQGWEDRYRLGHLPVLGALHDTPARVTHVGCSGLNVQSGHGKHSPQKPVPGSHPSRAEDWDGLQDAKGGRLPLPPPMCGGPTVCSGVPATGPPLAAEEWVPRCCRGAGTPHSATPTEEQGGAGSVEACWYRLGGNAGWIVRAMPW